MTILSGPSKHLNGNTARTDDFYDVVIVGAGWAGLAAARRFSEQESVIHFRVLEARDYIGGRSHTIPVDFRVETENARVDLGSTWVHGAKGNPIQKFIDQNNLAFSKVKYNNQVWSGEEGVIITPDQIKKVHDRYWKGDNGFFRFQKKQQDDAKDRKLREVADDYIRKEESNFNKNPQHKLVFEWLLDRNTVLQYGGSLEDLSLWWWDSDKMLPGGDSYIATSSKEGGYSSIVNVYAEPIKSQIQLKSKVTEVDYNSSIVTVKYIDSWGVAQSIQAQNIILTLPLGVLKSDTVTFIPKLPDEKKEAIQKLGNGLLNKCVIYWENDDDVFWPKDIEWIEQLSPSGNQGKWTEFYNPYSVNGGQPMLTAFISGREAWRVEDLTNEEVKDEVLTSLRSMFAIVPEPKKVIMTRWGKDEFSQGSYSFFKVGSTRKNRKNLAKAVRKRLYFAGEATSLAYFATTHGALLSGRTCANRITKKILASKENNEDSSDSDYSDSDYSFESLSSDSDSEDIE